MDPAGIERECKIPVPALEPLAARLAGLGAEFLGGGREANALFDDPDGALAARGALLRLRTVEGRPGGTLTAKGRAVGGAFKAREEWETAVEDPEATRRLLSLLGYAETRRYEKDRDEWRYEGARIALDRLPEIGAFVEVEGDETAIRRVLASLGLDPLAHVADTYLGLWSQHLARQGLAPRDMTFVGALVKRPPSSRMIDDSEA